MAERCARSGTRRSRTRSLGARLVATHADAALSLGFSRSTKYARRILPIVSTVIIPAGPLCNQRRHLPLPELVNFWAPSPADPQAQPVNYSMPNYMSARGSKLEPTRTR